MPSALDPGPPAGLDAYEDRLAQAAPGYLERVRDHARRLGVRAVDLTDARSAVEAVEELAAIDVVAPTASRRPAGRIVKTLIAKAVSWYLRYLGEQMTSLGQSVAHMGATILDRTEAVERRTDSLASDVARLQERVERLESGEPDR